MRTVVKYQIQQLTVQKNGPRRWTVVFETLDKTEAYRVLESYRHAMAVEEQLYDGKKHYIAPVHLVHVSKVVNAGNIKR